jgi:hypothetical protein
MNIGRLLASGYWHLAKFLNHFKSHSNSLEKSCKIPVYKVSRELLLLVV